MLFFCARSLTPASVFRPTQDRGGEVRRVLSEIPGANSTERRAGSETLEDGDRLHPAEEPLPPLTAFQHPSSLHERHLPGGVIQKSGTLTVFVMQT